MADPDSKARLTDRQMDDAMFLLRDRADRQRAINVREEKSPDGSRSLSSEKNGLTTRYTVNLNGTVGVRVSDFSGNSSQSRIAPDGSVVSGRVETGANLLTPQQERALQSGARQEAQSLHQSVGFNVGPLADKSGSNPQTRTAQELGQRIEAQADVRLAARLEGEKTGDRVLEGIVDRKAADRMADRFEALSRDTSNLSAEDTQRLTRLMADGKVEPEALRQGLGDYAARLRGPEGAGMVAELREAGRAKEAMALTDDLMNRPARLTTEAAAPHAEGGGKGVVPETHGKMMHGKGNMALNGVFAVAAGGAALAAGASPAQAAEATVAAGVPYYDAGREAAQGHLQAAGKSATLETAALGTGAAGAAGGAALGAATGVVGAPVVLGVVGAVAAGTVGYEAGKMIYETPERLRVAARYESEKAEILKQIPDSDEWASAYKGRPARAVDTLRDPEALRNYEASLKSEGRTSDLEALESYKAVEKAYVQDMKDFGVDASPQKRESDRQLNTAHQFGL